MREIKNKMKNKKAQLKIQEMSFMLIAVVLFFILAGLFAVSVIYSNLHGSATQIEEEKTYSAILNLASSAEFSCGKPNCVDADKLIVLASDKADVYKKFWPFSSLVVITESGLNKEESEMIECTKGNYPNCDKFVVFDKDKEDTTKSTFIALCRKENENGRIYDKCEIAKFWAGSEVK